jgi:tetratricopeptide (TPR) repeat protein
MKIAVGVLLLLGFSCVGVCAQQNGAPKPLPAPMPAGTPNTDASAVGKKEAGNVNADLIAARAATKAQRYGDAEALMEKDTRENPGIVLAWIELGLAQMGLEQYDKAENSFQIALGIDPATVAKRHNGDFYQNVDAPGVVAPGATRASRNAIDDEVVTTSAKRTPDVLGTAYASLGEIYIHKKEFAEAKQAFDTALKDNPTEAPLYRSNEAIFFFKAGDADDQLAAAQEGIAIDPTRASLYYFKGQALVSKATVDPKTQKIVLPPGCAAAYQKYLQLEPNGQFSADAKGVLAAAGVAVKK